jgi:arylsulfatase A-like enzyme
MDPLKVTPTKGLCMKISYLLAAVMVVAISLPTLAAPILPPRHNVLIFVADGLRANSVNPNDTPTMWALKKNGVSFVNPHSIYPTITTVNASAIATGHYIGDTGNFGNQLYTSFASLDAGGAMTPFLESDAVLGQMNDHFGGNYLHEESLLAAARKAGFHTAAFGKTGAAAIQDVTARDGTQTIVIDDSIGTPGSIPVSPVIEAAMRSAGIRPTAPKSAAPNNAQEKYLLDIATKIVLPRFRRRGKPFAILFWSRDPDGTQHSQKESLGKVSPGINGDTSKAGIKDADDTLAGLLGALKSLGFDKTTDIFVTADHGFSAIAKHSETSAAARYETADGPENAVDTQNAPPSIGQRDLPQGFLAIDLADALKLPLFDPNTSKRVDFTKAEHPSYGNGYIGNDPAHPDVIVAANGGSDEIWLLRANGSEVARRIVAILAEEDYVSGIFSNSDLGEIPGTLPLSAISLEGAALTPHPSLIINFRSFATPGCLAAVMCAAEVADTSLATGQGMHGSFSRADTMNFMAAAGPDFKAGFMDTAPASNADIAPTLAHILRLTIAAKGSLTGRVLTEALPGGRRVTVTRGWLASKPGVGGHSTVLNFQQVGGTRYYDAAGYPGRTVGLVVH